MDISAQTPTLNMVVTQYKSLVVEDYQRTYSWQREQIDELFLDLIDCTGSSDNHFFGTLILQESDSQTATIVDGQQRLTTVFIIVAALRDELLKLSTQTIAPMNQNQRPTDVIKKAWDFLYPTNDFTVQRFGSSRFLKSLMKDRVIAEPTGREDIPQRDNKFKKVTLDFRKAVRHIRKWVDLDLDEYSDDIAKLHRINILLDTLLNRFIVLRVPTQNLTESLEIFLTLNNRGLPLGPSDLVRGEVMSILGTDKSEVEQVKIHKKVLSDWETIVELVHEPEVFLRHFLVATSATKIQKKKIVKEVMERLADNDLNSKKDKTKELWADLQVKAKVYNQIVNPTMGGDCAFHIELSEGLGKSHRILLISVLSHISNLRDRDELVRLTMILAYRNAMAGLNAQKLEDFFQSQSTIIRLESDHASVQENLKARDRKSVV